MQCPNCKEEMADDARKCPHCGEWLPEIQKVRSKAIVCGIFLSLSTFFLITRAIVLSLNKSPHYWAGTWDFNLGRILSDPLVIIALLCAIISAVVYQRYYKELK